LRSRRFFGRAFQPAESLKAMVYSRDGNLPGLRRADRATLVAAAAASGELPAASLRSTRLALPVTGVAGEARALRRAGRHRGR
jgi:hypothetical protein